MMLLSDTSKNWHFTCLHAEVESEIDETIVCDIEYVCNCFGSFSLRYSITIELEVHPSKTKRENTFY